jgi:hypothetical protein
MRVILIGFYKKKQSKICHNCCQYISQFNCIPEKKILEILVQKDSLETETKSSRIPLYTKRTQKDN